MTLKEASLNIPEEEYHAYPCLSYSLLQRYDREGYKSIDTLLDPISSPSLLFGSLVDGLITKGSEEFYATYAAYTGTLPSDTIMSILSIVASQCSEKHLEDVPDSIIIDAADTCSYQKTWKPSTRVAKIIDQGGRYYNFMKANEDKNIVSKHDWEDALRCAEALKSDSVTRSYFVSTCFENVDHLYQLQFVTRDDVTNIEYKGMLDLVLVDHDYKKIYPCDLKTTKSIYTFASESFYNYRYYIQAAMYTELLRKVIKAKCPELVEYSIEPYRFIVISRSSFKPVVFEWVVPKDHTKLSDPAGNPLADWRELMVQVQWALDHKEELLPKDWYDSIKKDGIIHIKQYSKNV